MIVATLSNSLTLSSLFSLLSEAIRFSHFSRRGIAYQAETMDREMNFRRDFEIHKAKNEKQIANFSMNIDDNIDMTCTILPSFHSLL